MTEPAPSGTDPRVQRGEGRIGVVGEFIPNAELPQHPSNAGPPAETVEAELAESNGTAQEIEPASDEEASSSGTGLLGNLSGGNNA